MIAEFLKSLISPAKMKKYRSMSILIAIGIFVLSFYILIAPFYLTIKNRKDEYIEKNVLFVSGLYELESNDNEQFTNLKQGNYLIKDNKLTTTRDENSPYDHYTFSYTNKNEKEIVVHFIFDPYDTRINRIDYLKEEYLEIYEGTDAKANEIAFLTYIEEQKNPELNYEEYFEELNGLSSEKLTERINNVTLFDLFNIETSKDYDSYLIIFNSSSFDYQVPLYNQKGEKIESRYTFGNFQYFDDFKFNVQEYHNISDLSKEMTGNIIEYQMMRDKQQYSLNAILFVLLYPTLIIFILWLMFRKNSVLKTFKEYYNIAAISSIIPTLITFVISWVFTEALSFYGMLLAIYYVFILYRVNTIPDGI